MHWSACLLWQQPARRGAPSASNLAQLQPPALPSRRPISSLILRMQVAEILTRDYDHQYL